MLALHPTLSLPRQAERGSYSCWPRQCRWLCSCFSASGSGGGRSVRPDDPGLASPSVAGLFGPVFDLQAGNLLEIVHVARDERVAKLEYAGGDAKIGLA